MINELFETLVVLTSVGILAMLIIKLVPLESISNKIFR